MKSSEAESSEDSQEVSDQVREIERRAHAVPGEHSIEEHGNGWAFYSGRKHPKKGEIFGGWHGLNLLYLTEPDQTWPHLKAFLENAHRDILLLIEYYRAARLSAQTANADLTAIGALCGQTEGERPLQAVGRLAREHREMKQRLAGRNESTLMSERAKLRSPNHAQLSPEEQWAEDKRLGILDWDGSEDK